MSDVSFHFPWSQAKYNGSDKININGSINGKTELDALNTVIKSVFPESTPGFRENMLRDIACGAYTSKATTPSINALMVQLLRNLYEGTPTLENGAAREWLIREIGAANPGKNLESIFNEACAIRYDFVSGARDILPYENPILPRISSTLYQWDYFPTLIKSPVNSDFQYPKIVEKIRSNKNLTLNEFKLLTQTALAEKEYILSIPGGTKTYPTRLSMLKELLKTIQGITLLSPSQIITYK